MPGVVGGGLPERIAPQEAVVVEVLVASGEPEDALGEERPLGVDNAFGRAGVGDGRVERRGEADPATGLPEEQQPASEVMWPAVNSATSSRRRTRENETGGVVRCVIAVVVGEEWKLCGNSFPYQPFSRRAIQLP